MYSCYYCNSYQTDLEKNYERHVILSHPKRPAYPSKVDLERLGIHGQGKGWEI
jgi:proteasome lid subunit RPN8/RPN11